MGAIKQVAAWAAKPENRYVIGACLTALGGAIAKQLDWVTAGGIILAALSRHQPPAKTAT